MFIVGAILYLNFGIFRFSKAMDLRCNRLGIFDMKITLRSAGIAFHSFKRYLLREKTGRSEMQTGRVLYRFSKEWSNVTPGPITKASGTKD